MTSIANRRAYRTEMLLASAMIVAGLTMSAAALAQLAPRHAQMAEATPPQPARPDADAQKAGAASVLPSAPAEKMAPAIPAK